MLHVFYIMKLEDRGKQFGFQNIIVSSGNIQKMMFLSEA